MPHVLIVGGTGMLSNVVQYYASHGCTVSVIARDPAGFNRLIESKDQYGFINPVKVNYSDYDLLREKISSAIGSYGSIEECVMWIHSTAPEAPYIVAEILNEQGISCKLYHILSSMYADPLNENKEIQFTFERFVNVEYRKIILGFITDGEISRWLNDTEIGNGVTDAVMKEKPEYVVGKIEPWSLHP